MEKLSMANKAFLLQRIRVYAKSEIDPCVDVQVKEMLKNRFNILLPQRRSMDESLQSAKSEHEILALILEYRSMCNA